MINKFLIKWILLTIPFLSVGYITGYIAGLLTGSLFGLTVADDGTHLIQTVVYCVFGSVVITVGVFQWLAIRKQFNNSVYWIPANVLGWGLGHLVMFHLMAFFLGGLLLGIITGLFFYWIIKSNKLIIN